MATTWLKIDNRAKSTLDGTLTDAATSFAVAAGEGARFPSTYNYHVQIGDDSQGYEIVRVTNRSTDTFTVVRAQEGDGALPFDDATPVRLVITKQYITELQDAINLRVEQAASSTDNAVARFDGTSGDKVQNCGVIIDDSNNVTGIAALTMTADLAVQGGDIYCGVNDTTKGRLILWGHATGDDQGGSVYLYLSDDHDATISNYGIDAYEDDLRIQPDTAAWTMYIRNDGDVELPKDLSVAGDVTVTGNNISDSGGVAITFDGSQNVTLAADLTLSKDEAALAIGVDHAARGILYLYGDEDTTGPIIRMYNAANEDGTVDWWHLKLEGTDLWLGPNTDPDEFLFGNGGTLAMGGALTAGGAITGASLIGSQATFPVVGATRTSSQTAVLYGVIECAHTTTNDAADGFGAGVSFRITDDGAGPLLLGAVGAVRDTADTEGALHFLCGTDGAEVFMVLDHDGNLAITGDLTVTGNNISDSGGVAVTFDGSGGVTLAAGLTVTTDVIVTGGDVTCGVNSTTRGTITLWDGGGGNTPGYVAVGSPNGTIWYLFVEDDGTVKVHNAVPTANGDGSEVGGQS